MRVVHLTTVHPADDTRIFHRQCRSLADAGYDVTLIAVEATQDGDSAVRLRPLPRPRNRLERLTLTAARALRMCLRERGDLYHIHDPELLLAALALKATGRKVIFDAHEDLPAQVAGKEWIHPRLRKPIGCVAATFFHMVLPRLDGVVTATPAIARELGFADPVVVQNFADAEFTQSPAASPYQSRPQTAAYVGVLSRERGACELVQAMSRLPEELGVSLGISGRFSPPSLEGELRRIPGWERVQFHGWQPRERILTQLASARVGVITFHPGPNHSEAQPNKLFEYMAAGLPVVASDFPLWREVLEGYDCGVLVNPTCPESIAEALEWLFRHPNRAEAMGLRGRAAVENHLNWSTEAKKLIRLYQNVLE